MNTVNLLPQQEKELLFLEEKWKLIFILEIIILAFLISLTLILFSIKTYISGQEEVQKILLSQKEAETPHMQELEEQIKDSNLIFSKLNSFYQSNLQLTEILTEISQILPEGIYLDTLSFTLPAPTEEYLAEIAFSGFASNRETLLVFKENLEKHEKFTEINFPPSAWLKPTDINFSVGLKISK